MTYFTQTPTSPTTERLMGGLALPVGLANPFWLAYGAAAGAAATWWWMTRWAMPVGVAAVAERVVAPAAALTPPPETVHETVAVLEATPEQAEEPAPSLAAPVAAPEAPMAGDAPPAPATADERPVAHTCAPMADTASDDFTRLIGVGPRTAAAFAAKGIHRFAQLAAWTAEEMAAFDAELNLRGRSVRDAWLDQARALATGA